MNSKGDYVWDQEPSFSGASQMDENGPCVRTLEGHSKSVTSLYYEDGCLVCYPTPVCNRADGQVTGSSDKTIRQWDVATGQCILTMDILWAISNPPHPPPEPTRPPRLSHRSSTSFGAVHYDDILPSPGPSTLGISGSSLLGAVSSGQFAVPTPPYADGSWEMYQDFVGGVQFWGYALASGSGDGAVRMWDSGSFFESCEARLTGSANGPSTPYFDRTYCTSHMSPVRRNEHHHRISRQDHTRKLPSIV
jgi:division protein 1